MSRTELTNIELTQSDQDFLTEIGEALPSELLIGHEAAAVSWVEQRVHDASNLPPKLSELKNTFENPVSAIHISGLCLPDLPPTPIAYQPPERAEVYLFDIAQIAVASLAGAAYGNSHVRAGRILADVFPKAGYETKVNTAFGSTEEFDFHADGAVQHDTTPNLFSLHCIRNTEQAPTFFSTVTAEDFDEEVLEALKQPAYTLYYETDHTGSSLIDTPILEEETDGRLRINYYGAAKAICSLTVENPAQYKQALQEFKTALLNNVQSVTLQPGDMLFVDNRHTQHGRRGFQASMTTAGRRWLRRIFIAQDPELVAKIQVSDDRVLMSQYV